MHMDKELPERTHDAVEAELEELRKKYTQLKRQSRRWEARAKHDDELIGKLGDIADEILDALDARSRR